MIVEIKNDLSADKKQEISKTLNAFVIENQDIVTFITPSNLKELPKEIDAIAERKVIVDNGDIQLASRKYMPQTREIKFGKQTIGGSSNNTLMIAGPCSIESESQIEQSAQLLKKLNISTLRAGCYKPRTSPYSFQGLGFEGLQMLVKVREKHGLNIITEVRDFSHVHEVIENTDIVQVGAKAMYDQGILRACGKSNKPVLIKRGFGTTLQEFVQAAEFVLSAGNPNVMLCERGIRTFETKTRFTLDLCGVAWLKEYINLPVVLDPSHAMGYAYGIPDLTRACVAMGVDGLLIEVHPTPKTALSDAAQQLDHETFTNLKSTLDPIAKAIGRTII